MFVVLTADPHPHLSSRSAVYLRGDRNTPRAEEPLVWQSEVRCSRPETQQPRPRDEKAAAVKTTGFLVRARWT